jgi:serine/threonine protein kinase
MNDLYAKYRVLRQISEGAHSKVYLAENRITGKKVAIKALS